jgi:hypothetical protein
MQSPEQDLIDLFKSKQFKAHLACLKKDAKIKTKVERLEEDFKALDGQIKEKADMRTQPYDMLKSIDLAIAMLTTVRDIISIQGEDAFMDAAVDKCPKTLKDVTKVTNQTALRQIEHAMTTMQKVKKGAKKRAAAEKKASA